MWRCCSYFSIAGLPRGCLSCHSVTLLTSLLLGFFILLHEAADQDSTGSGTLPSKTTRFSLTSDLLILAA